MNSLEKIVVEKYKVVNFLSLEIRGDHVWLHADDEQPFITIPTSELLEAIEGHPLYQEALYDYQDLCKRGYITYKRGFNF